MEILTRPQHYDISFSIASIVLILVTIAIHLTEERFNSKQRYYFGAIIFDAFLINVMGLIHSLWMYSDFMRYFISYDANKVIVICEKLFIYLLPFFSIRYVMAIFNIDIDVPWRKLLLLIPTIFSCYVIFSGMFTEFFLYFDENGIINYVYPQGATVNIGVLLYFIFAVYLLTRYGKSLSSEKAVALWIYFFIMLSGVPIRIFTKSSAAFGFSVSIALLLCVYTFQNPYEFVDRMSHAGTKNALNFAISTNLLQKKDFTLLGIRIDRLGVLLGGEPTEAASDLLNQISQYLKQLSPEKNLFYTGEGDFIMLFPDVAPDEDIIEKTAEQVRKRFKDTWKIRDEEVKLFESPYAIGFPEEVDSLERYGEVKSVFDKTLLRQNRDILRISDLNLKIVEHDKKIDNIVKHALDDGLLEVYYQPIYSPKEGKFLSCEALLRLKDPQLGFISPAIFMPIAERNGTILGIDKFVLSSVCDMLSNTEARNYGLEYVEVNLSVVDCIQTNLADNVIKTMDKYLVEPSEIKFELTETFEQGITAAMDENMNKLIENGVSFAMDDFGTGYSNLVRIANMPVSIFKLDKSIIQSAFESEVSYMVMLNMIKIIKALGKEIVAEGVETGEQARQIIKLGCDHIQGFFYARPLTREKFIGFLKDHNG